MIKPIRTSGVGRSDEEGKISDYHETTARGKVDVPGTGMQVGQRGV